MATNGFKAKSWLRLVLCYWLLMAGIFFLEFRHMDSDWAGLPGFVFTLPLSALVVAIGLLPAILARFGYDIKLNFTDYQFEYGFVVCAVLNAFALYPFYRFWTNRKQAKVYEPPSPDNSFNSMPR